MPGSGWTSASRRPRAFQLARGGSPRDLTHTWSARLAPAREDADAVARAEHRPARASHGQALEHALADLVGGLDVERHARHHAERAERDDHAVEVRIAAAGGDQLAARGHQLQRRDRGREVAGPGAVGGGGDRARDRDVRQRAQVVQRQPVRASGARRRRRSAGGPAPSRSRRRPRCRRGRPSSATSSSESPMSVNEWREPIARMRGARDDDLPQLLDRPRAVHRPRPVLVVARPVAHQRRRTRSTSAWICACP